MKIEALKNVKYNGEYNMPGTIFECTKEEADRLIKIGSATETLDPRMLQIAGQKLKVAESQRDDIKEDLSDAKDEISAHKRTIANLKEQLERADKKDKETIQCEIDEANKDVNTVESERKSLIKKLNNKEKEITKYDVNKK